MLNENVKEPGANGALGRSPFDAILNEPNVDAHRGTVAAGTVIHETTDPAQSVFVIHRGQVRIYQLSEQGDSRLCEILGPGEWFGEAALARAETYGVRAVAVGPCVVSDIRADLLLAAMSRQPELLVIVNRQLATRLQRARDEAAELMFKDTNQRLVKTLIRFARSAASTPVENGVVLSITHSQLAQAVGAARETISLALTQLRQQNLVRTGRNQLFFNPNVLKELNSDCCSEVEHAS